MAPKTGSSSPEAVPDRTISPLISIALFVMPLLAIAPRKTTIALSPLIPLILTAPFSSRARYYLRVITFFWGLGVCSLWGVVSGMVIGLVKPSWRRNIQWLVARSFYRLVSPLVGIEFVIEGEEHLADAQKGVPHVLIGNHQSMVRASSRVFSSFF